MQSHQVAGKSHDIVDPSLGREVVSEGQPCPSLAIADPPHAAHSAAAGLDPRSAGGHGGQSRFGTRGTGSRRDGCRDADLGGWAAVALPDRVTRQDAAVVFRRAAELDAAEARGDASALIDVTTVIGIGRDAGLSPTSVQAALAELQDGALAEASPAADIVRSRIVPGERRDVRAAIEELARANLLVPSHQDNSVSVWIRRRGAAVTMRRSLGGRERFPLLALKELRVTATEPRPGLVRLRMEGRLVFPWRLLPLRTKAVVAGGIGGGAVVLALALAQPGMELDDSLYSAGALLASVGVTGRGVRAYREAVVFTERTIDWFLDRLQQQVPQHQA